MLAKDPVELLKEIKVQMHNTVRTQLLEWTRITATEKFLSFCQQDLSLADYIVHFEELRNILLLKMKWDSMIPTLL